jgi:hypothetical protein
MINVLFSLLIYLIHLIPTTLGLSRHGGEELEWLGCGSGEWLGW